MVALAFLVVGGQVLALLAASARLVVRDLVALAFLVVGGLGPGPVACCLLPVACCLLPVACCGRRSPVARAGGQWLTYRGRPRPGWPWPGAGRVAGWGWR